MSPEFALHQYLNTCDLITSLVADRIYSNHLPQTNTTYPALVVSLIDSPNDQALLGPTGTIRCRFQMDCYSDDFQASLDLAEAVRLSLDGFTGRVADRLVKVCRRIDARDLSEHLSDGSDWWLYRQSADYRIVLSESIPSFAIGGAKLSGTATIS